MKSIADDKLFDVDDTLDSLSFSLDTGTEPLSGAKKFIRDFRHNLRKLRGRDIYDAEKLRLLVNHAFKVPKKKRRNNHYY